VGMDSWVWLRERREEEGDGLIEEMLTENT
jgi:hypothetical protein